MFAFEWYVYLLIMVCVAVPMGVFYAVEVWRERRKARAEGPHPCMAYLGKDAVGVGYWCWKPYRHVGEHLEVYDENDIPGYPDVAQY